MVAHRDNLREEAFKVILEDIERSTAVYDTKINQESRIASLITNESLQIKKAKAIAAVTPTAAELRTLLIAYISSNRTPYKGLDVFKVGSDTLNSDQLSALKSVRPQIKLRAIEAQNSGSPVREVEQSAYCYCRKNNGQELIRCSNDSCERKFYHPGCVDLERKLDDGKEWLCPDCTLPSDSSLSDIGDTDGEKGRGKKRSIDEVSNPEAAAISDERNSKRIRSADEGEKQKSRIVSQVGSVQAHPGPAGAGDMISDPKQGAQSSKVARSNQRTSSETIERIDDGVVVAGKANGGVSGLKRRRDDGLESDQPRERREQGNPASINLKSVAGDVDEPQAKRSKTSEQASDLHNLEAGIDQESAIEEAESLPDTANAQGKVQSQTSQAASYPDRLKEIEDLTGDWSKVRSDIQGLAAAFYEEFALEKSSVPPFAADPSAHLERLYQLILGDWREQILLQDPNYLRWNRVLQALIGASLYERVLSKPVPWQTPRQLLQQLRPWQHSYDRLLRYFTDRIPGGLEYVVWQTGMNVLDDSAFVKKKIEPIAQDLGKAVLGDVKSHLQQVLGRANLRNSEGPDFWQDCLENAIDICRLALITQGRLDAAPHDYEYYWISPGAKMEKYWAEYIGVGAPEEVVMCILPGIKFVDRDGELRQAAKAQVVAKIPKKNA